MTLIFAIFYWLLSKFGLGGLAASRKLDAFDYYYFSVVTVSTLGFGDIVPIGAARIFVCCEVIFGLVFVGYSLSQILSARQEYLVEYLTADRIMQTYSKCLIDIADAKEFIGDRRRFLQHTAENSVDFIYNRANPFYPALKAMKVLNAYTAHVEQIGRAQALSSQLERAAHHVEEMASFARKYLNILIAKKVPWKTRRTIMILDELCNEIDEFSNNYTVHTRYFSEKYKGNVDYQDIVNSITSKIRSNVEVI